MFGDFTHLQSLDTPEKNCNIFCWSKILSSWIFLLLKSTEVTSPRNLFRNYRVWVMNPRISVYFHQIVPVRLRIKWYIFSMSILRVFTTTQIPGLTSLPLSLRAKKSTKIKCSTDKIYYNFIKYITIRYNNNTFFRDSEKDAFLA